MPKYLMAELLLKANDSNNITAKDGGIANVLASN